MEIPEMLSKQSYKPSAEETLDYAVAVTVKQCGCTADEAAKKLKKLGKGVVQKIHDAGRQLDLHTVRNLLGLPVPGLPDELDGYEVVLGSTIHLPAGDYQFKILRQHSSGGGVAKPVAILVRNESEKATKETPDEVD